MVMATSATTSGRFLTTSRTCRGSMSTAERSSLLMRTKFGLDGIPSLATARPSLEYGRSGTWTLSRG